MNCVFRYALWIFLAQPNNKTFIKVGNQDKRNRYFSTISLKNKKLVEYYEVPNFFTHTNVSYLSEQGETFKRM